MEKRVGSESTTVLRVPMPLAQFFEQNEDVVRRVVREELKTWVLSNHEIERSGASNLSDREGIGRKEKRHKQSKF